MKICMMEACETGHWALGLCLMHYQRVWRDARDRGQATTDLVCAKRTLAHVKLLNDRGLSYEEMCRIANYHRGDLQALQRGTSRRISQRYEAAFLRIKPGTLPTRPTALVAVLGTRRRICAMHAAGWPMHQIVDAIGLSKALTSDIAHGRAKSVTKATHVRVAEWYEKAQMIPGTSDRARKLGAKYGWALPFQWNDDEIDNPHSRPSKFTIARYQGTDRVVAA